jgi:hypothetical protein
MGKTVFCGSGLRLGQVGLGHSHPLGFFLADGILCVQDVRA